MDASLGVAAPGGKGTVVDGLWRKQARREARLSFEGAETSMHVVMNSWAPVYMSMASRA